MLIVVHSQCIGRFCLAQETVRNARDVSGGDWERTKAVEKATP